MIIENSFNLIFADFNLDGGTFMSVLGILDCAALCMNATNCCSFFYNHDMRSCAPSPGRFQTTTGLTHHPGIKYYSIRNGVGAQCSSSADCVLKNSMCKTESCQCVVGYSYQTSTDSCIIRCKEYGDAFAVYMNHDIQECNSKQYRRISKTDCLKLCLAERTFVCVNFEYGMIRSNMEFITQCNLCDTAWFDLYDYQRGKDSKGWTLFYRHCAG